MMKLRALSSFEEGQLAESDKYFFTLLYMYSSVLTTTIEDKNN